MISQIVTRTFLVSVFLSIALLSTFACNKTETTGEAKKEPKQVSAEQKTFQDAMTQMEEMKAEIQKHNDLYELAIKERRSLLDDRESKIAASTVHDKSKALYAFTIECLKNREVIRQVAGAENQYQHYKSFALKVMETFKEKR